MLKVGKKIYYQKKLCTNILPFLWTPRYSRIPLDMNILVKVFRYFISKKSLDFIIISIIISIFLGFQGFHIYKLKVCLHM